MKKYLKFIVYIILIISTIFLSYVISSEYYNFKKEIGEIKAYCKINTYLIDRVRSITNYYFTQIDKFSQIKDESTPEYYEKRTVIISDKKYPFCTGVVLSKHLVITCKHCTLIKSQEENNDIFVNNFKAFIIAKSKKYDLALLWVTDDLSKKGKLPIKGIKEGKKYQYLIIYGHPFVLRLTDIMSKGIILGETGFKNEMTPELINYQIIKDTIAGGNSGSGVYDENGYLIGIIWGRYRISISLGIMNTGNQIKEFLKETEFDYLFDKNYEIFK